MYNWVRSAPRRFLEAEKAVDMRIPAPNCFTVTNWSVVVLIPVKDEMAAGVGLGNL
jgi:hypothetical protein